MIDLKDSFVRKNSNVSPNTIANLTKKSKIDGSLPKSKQGDEKKTPEKHKNEFRKFVDLPENSEFADSGTKLVLVAPGIKKPIRFLIKPLSEMITNYKPYQLHRKRKKKAKIHIQIAYESG